VHCCLLADCDEEAMPESSPNRNIWKERFEFYRSAQPKNEEEEDLMIKRALEESQKLEEERQRRILQETTSRIRILYWIFYFYFHFYYAMQC